LWIEIHHISLDSVIIKKDTQVNVEFFLLKYKKNVSVVIDFDSDNASFAMTLVFL